MGPIKTPSPPFVTVVSGLPRSGTSLMMQMLFHGGIPVLTDHVRVADADNPRGYFEFEPVKQIRNDIRWLENARGKAIKMVYLLLYDLPKDYDYRVILMLRRIDEVISSQNAMLLRRGKPEGDVDRQALARGFEERLQKVEAWLATHQNFRLLRINYAEVIAHPYDAASQVEDFLEMKLDVDAMVGTVDPELYRQHA
jgi:hypothetical protein